LPEPLCVELESCKPEEPAWDESAPVV